ncbi:MAG TPA: 50S ribosomal protein L21 [Candidatus Paceibacterota bacterium]
MKIAVIKTGGKQYLVTEGETITIEKLGSAEGSAVSFEVLLTDDGATTEVGTPLVSGAKIEGTVVSEGKAKKLTVVKYKAKSRYFKKRGHRQPFTKVRIDSI